MTIQLDIVNAFTVIGHLNKVSKVFLLRMRSSNIGKVKIDCAIAFGVVLFASAGLLFPFNNQH